MAVLTATASPRGCADASLFTDHVRNGAGAIPAFPLLSDADALAIHDWVFTSFCPLAP